MRTPYPRTPHLPWSPGAAADDVRDVAGLRGKKVVVTEKLNGENTTLYADFSHVRSVDSGQHPSRSWGEGGYRAGSGGRCRRGLRREQYTTGIPWRTTT